MMELTGESFISWLGGEAWLLLYHYIFPMITLAPLEEAVNKESICSSIYASI